MTPQEQEKIHPEGRVKPRCKHEWRFKGKEMISMNARTGKLSEWFYCTKCLEQKAIEATQLL